ncbi:MAG: serine/threonine-protein kinase, partial [Patescibacteria group bacterium]|nr:serine/threonine-protein kinase [Patescibacteria group bacterium]
MDSHPPFSRPTIALEAEDSRAQGDSRSLGQYELLERLGAGGMGTVYRAIHSRLKRAAAIKLLRADRIEHRDSLARFLGEMEAVGRLDHPNLIRAYDAGEVDGQHYLVMELIVGVDLRKLVTQLGPLRISDACEVIAQAARGLRHAHENGLVHRDVKPSNLMVTCEGMVKLLDLGIARLAPENGGEPEYSVTDQILGSADYLAPEQGQNPHLADARSDIYALGCTLYYLLAGCAPFADTRHNTLGRKLLAHATERVPDINRVRGDVPKGLVGVLRRMLAKRPEDRPANMTEVEEALLAWSAGSDLPLLVGRLPRMEDIRSPEPPGMETRMWRTATHEDGRGTHSSTAVFPQPRPRRSWLRTVIGAMGLGGLVVAGLVLAALLIGLPRPSPE